MGSCRSIFLTKKYNTKYNKLEHTVSQIFSNYNSPSVSISVFLIQKLHDIKVFAELVILWQKEWRRTAKGLLCSDFNDVILTHSNFYSTSLVGHHFISLILNLLHHCSALTHVYQYAHNHQPPIYVKFCHGLWQDCGLVSICLSQNGTEIFIPARQIDWCLIHRFQTVALLTLDCGRRRLFSVYNPSLTSKACVSGDGISQFDALECMQLWG